MKYAVNFDDPHDVRRWLDALRAQAEDLVDLSEAATLRKNERTISRSHIRAELEKTGMNLRKLLRAARRGLPSKATPHH